MSYEIRNYVNNDDIITTKKKGPFSILEYGRDLSLEPQQALQAYFMSEMGVHRRQLMCDIDRSPVIISSGAMQWMVGDVKVSTDIKGASDLVGKLVKGKMTGEQAIKPLYSGRGKLILEPTFKHLILWDLESWGGGVVLDDGMFLACEASIRQTIQPRTNMSSTVLGGEGWFNLKLKGKGVFCVESPCPEEELVVVRLKDDVLKIDGNFAVAWSSTLEFSVEKTTKTLVGSAASGEGLVNVYRGTGDVVMMPVR